jgi:hypothetical protein
MLLAMLSVCAVARPLHAQIEGVHSLHNSMMPPGAIGADQLQRGGPLVGYFQPIELIGPEGIQISLAEQGAFDPPQPVPRKVGLLIAPVYRLRITNIPGHEGLEVYPTVEVINRLYPPPGQAKRHPIPVELTADDLRLAINGQFLTRVVYLEDPYAALPGSEGENGNWFDSGTRDPLEVADQLGRPMVIVRMGGRLPDNSDGPDMQFLHGCPPFVRFRQLQPEWGNGLEARPAAAVMQRAAMRSDRTRPGVR